MESLATLRTDRIALSDAGVETVLIFHGGWDLPSFASFPLLDTDDGRSALSTYYREFVELAESRGADLILETPTWRANRDWGRTLGYNEEDLRRVQHDAVAFVRGVAIGSTTVVVSGSIGPRGDGYVPGSHRSADVAADYHHPQVRDLSEAGASVVTAMTLSYAAEGVGIVWAAAEVGVPVVVGFTVETDGRLPSGEPLAEAIEKVDSATNNYASWFMINCAHPDHIARGLVSGPWLERVGAIRANASRQTHAELDEATELDAGDPRELAEGYVMLREQLPSLQVVGGCCGTDVRHVAAMADALV